MALNFKLKMKLGNKAKAKCGGCKKKQKLNSRTGQVIKK